MGWTSAENRRERRKGYETRSRVRTTLIRSASSELSASVFMPSGAAFREVFVFRLVYRYGVWGAIGLQAHASGRTVVPGGCGRRGHSRGRFQVAVAWVGILKDPSRDTGGSARAEVDEREGCPKRGVRKGGNSALSNVSCSVCCA